jgi:predicted  nucleic acid-binding Zn-ribbon protein
MNLEKLYTPKKRVIAVFRSGKYTKDFILAIDEIQFLFSKTILLPTTISLTERLFCYNYNIKFRPVCRICGEKVSFDYPARKYKSYCSEKCASAEYHLRKLTDEQRLKISAKSIASNRKQNALRLIEWKATAISLHPTLDFSKFNWQPDINHESTIVCNIHGESIKSIHSLVNGIGCPKCGNINRRIKLSKTKIEKSSELFWKFMHEYKPQQISANTVFTGNNDVTWFICSTHGEILATPGYMRNSKFECPICGKHHGAICSPIDINDVKEYISMNSNITLLSSEYVGIRAPLKCNCETHGEFYTTFEHIKGSLTGGCPKCGKIDFSNKRAYNITQVNNILSEVHPNVKCLSYKRSDTISTFVCKTHGEFEDTFISALYNKVNACPSCRPSNASAGELEVVSFIESLGIKPKVND